MPGQRLVLFLVAGTFFMEMLDSTVITTALPRIARDFGVSAVALNIGITAYLIALSAFLPISSWIARRFGQRGVFAGAIAVFTIASLLCGLSRDVWSFTAARALQGAGGAAMVPVGRLIVLGITKREDLAKAMATIVWPGLAAPMLAPPLAGFIVMHFSWTWIFFLNIPLGFGAVVVALIFVPKSGESRQGRPFDPWGFVSSAAALALLVYGLDLLGNGLQSVRLPASLILAGSILAVFCVRHFRRHPTPLLDLSPLGVRTFAMVAAGGSLQRIAIGAVPFLLPLMFQLGFGMNPLTAGGLVLFVFFGNLAMKIVSFRILRKFGIRQVLIANGMSVAIAIGACGLLTRTTPYWLIAAVLFIGGASRSLQFAGLAGVQFIDIERKQLGDANTLSSMLTNLTLGLGLGVVIGAGMLNLSAMMRGRQPGTPDPADFRFAFAALMVVALLGLMDTFCLNRSRT